jgi:hypothetical protein
MPICTHGALRVISSARLYLSVKVWRPTAFMHTQRGSRLPLTGRGAIELRLRSDLDRPGLGRPWHSIGSPQGPPAVQSHRICFVANRPRPVLIFTLADPTARTKGLLEPDAMS